MPQGFSAQGTLLASSPDPNWPPSAPVGGTVTFTTLAELRNFTPPPMSRNPLETTTHNEGDDTYVVGIRRTGEMQANINYVPTNATHDASTGLLKDFQDGTRKIYRITYPDGYKWLFSGFVSNFAPTAPVDDVLTADVTWRPTGTHIFTAS